MIAIAVNNKTRNRINLLLIKKVAEKFLRYYRREKCEVSIVFVGDKIIRRLNLDYRGIDRVTDVLAYSGDNIPDFETGKKFIGEIIIDYAQIKRQAKKFSGTVKDELIFILVHGLLHLLGYKDESEKEKREMERLGKKFIDKYSKLNKGF